MLVIKILMVTIELDLCLKTKEKNMENRKQNLIYIFFGSTKRKGNIFLLCYFHK